MKGLFHSDQNLKGDSQKYTRQNPNGDRRGLECPEERDYYPYWNPTPFHDIAIITPDVEYCKEHIQNKSQNVAFKYGCVRPDTEVTAGTTNIVNILPESTYIDYNLNGTECVNAGGSWEGFRWNGEMPECVESYWTKVTLQSLFYVFCVCVCVCVCVLKTHGQHIFFFVFFLFC